MYPIIGISLVMRNGKDDNAFFIDHVEHLIGENVSLTCANIPSYLFPTVRGFGC